MPPYTKLPRPAGHVYFSYSPMSPPNWGIVPFEIHVFVYPDVRTALQALLQAATTIQAQRLEAGSAELLTNHLFYRGHSDVTQRLLPTRLRGAWRPSPVRGRYGVDGNEEARNHFGDWFERIEPRRRIEDSLREVPDTELRARDAKELAAVQRASEVKEISGLDPFRKRAAVRHYGDVQSSLLDVSTDPEVAAFFATGGASRAPEPGSIGMLWAIDVNFLAGLFTLQTISVPGGQSTTLTENRDAWGDNTKMFEDYGVQPTRLELTEVELPFRRPQAQHARFFSLAGEDGALLPAKTELTWWSIIERRSYACAFIQDGRTYENPSHNITASTLWSGDEPLAHALAG